MSLRLPVAARLVNDSAVNNWTDVLRNVVCTVTPSGGVRVSSPGPLLITGRQFNTPARSILPP